MEQTSKELLSSLMKGKYTTPDLISLCLNEKIQPQCRSVLWKVFLNFLPINNVDLWEETLRQKRASYFQKLKAYRINVLMKVVNREYPQDSLELKQLYEEYTPKFIELISIIKIDIDRTLQDHELFQDNSLKQSLCKILCLWSTENIDIGYCQGMNEIIGTLCYALHPSFHKPVRMNVDNLILSTVNSEVYFEADLYTLFSEIMQRDMKNLYSYHDRNLLRYPCDTVDGFELVNIVKNSTFTLSQINTSSESELKKRIKKIFYIYLPIINEDLFKGLLDKVDPDIFLLRWILCLLNREFSLSMVIHLWDLIFVYEYADSWPEAQQSDIAKLGFLDHIILSMICSVKEELLSQDDGFMMLSCLMNFPKEDQMDEIISNAVKIRETLNEYLSTMREYVMIE